MKYSLETRNMYISNEWTQVRSRLSQFQVKSIMLAMCEAISGKWLY